MHAPSCYMSPLSPARSCLKDLAYHHLPPPPTQATPSCWEVLAPHPTLNPANHGSIIQGYFWAVSPDTPCPTSITPGAPQIPRGFHHTYSCVHINTPACVLSLPEDALLPCELRESPVRDGSSSHLCRASVWLLAHEAVVLFPPPIDASAPGPFPSGFSFPFSHPTHLAPVQKLLTCWETIRQSHARSPLGCAARVMPAPTTTTARTGDGAPGNTNTGLWARQASRGREGCRTGLWWGLFHCS